MRARMQKPIMKLRTVEYGTFWVSEPGFMLPAVYTARVDAEFLEFSPADEEGLSTAMDGDIETVRQRMASGRRCFGLKKNGLVIAYGWVTHGEENVGELERQFNFKDHELYIWDCRTIIPWRRMGCYSSLLNRIIYRMYEEQAGRLWIGAASKNHPSVLGIENAGFEHVVDLTYRRIYRLCAMWFKESPAASPTHVSAAYRILTAKHERRFRHFAVGWLQ